VAAGLLALACGLFLSITEAVADEPPMIAIVIDDVGLDVSAADRAADLPAAVTLALLPYAEAAPLIDAQARGLGHETLVHVPMEPRGLADPGPDALTTWLDADEIRARVEAALDRAPGAVGLSNHMGSRFTECATCVAPVVAAAAGRGLLVLDSVTTPDSRLAAAAERAGAPALRRDVFLDNVQSADAVLSALVETEEIALARGAAVAIGHPYPETLAALEQWIPEAQARGIRLVALSELAGERDAPRATLAALSLR
jgi:polysaccharide deacetylase 2 family uncharacterized protein YibQ